MIRVSRRRFSLLLSLAAGLGSTALLRRAWGRSADPHERLKRLLEATFSDAAGVRAIGQQYLASGPAATADALDLAERLLAKPPANSTDLRQILGRLRDDDLRRRALVRVDGWILPRLEAQVCALIVLL